MAVLFTLRAFASNLLRGNRRRNTFCTLFWCLAWGSNPGFTSNKPTHCPLPYGDFKNCSYQPWKTVFLLNTKKTCSNDIFFLKFFLELIFAIKRKTMLLKLPAVLLSSWKKYIYCVYYVSEHLKFYTQINKYWLNKTICLNLV